MKYRVEIGPRARGDLDAAYSYAGRKPRNPRIVGSNVLRPPLRHWNRIRSVAG